MKNHAGSAPVVSVEFDPMSSIAGSIPFADAVLLESFQRHLEYNHWKFKHRSPVWMAVSYLSISLPPSADSHLPDGYGELRIPHCRMNPLVARDLERPGLLVLNGGEFRQIDHYTPQGRSRLSAPVRFEHGQDDALLLERSQGRRGRGTRGSLRTWTAA